MNEIRQSFPSKSGTSRGFMLVEVLIALALFGMRTGRPPSAALGSILSFFNKLPNPQKKTKREDLKCLLIRFIAFTHKYGYIPRPKFKLPPTRRQSKVCKLMALLPQSFNFTTLGLSFVHFERNTNEKDPFEKHLFESQKRLF